MQLVLLILWTRSPTAQLKATLAAAAITLVDALALLILSHTEHVHSTKPSMVINVYVLLSCLLDIPRARTLWMDGDRSIAAVFSSSLAVKVLVLVTEAMEKRDILLSRYQHHPPEATSGIYSRSFFWWLNSLFSSGFRRSLSNDDLFSVDDSMTSSVLRDHLQRVWTASKKESSHALLRSTMKALRGPLGYCVFPRLCLTGFKYAQPFLIARTISFINAPHQADDIGWGLTAAYGFVFLGRAVANGSYYHMVYRFITSLRGSLVGIIYGKTVDLSITALDESAAVTLMSTDTEAICLAFVQVHEMWAVPIEIGLSLWLLQQQLGSAFLAVAMIATIGVLSTIWLSRYMGTAQKRWIQAIQTRVDTTASMLGSMKAVKMLGFTDILASMIQGLRVSELNLSGLFRRLTCVRVFLGKKAILFGQLVAHNLKEIACYFWALSLHLQPMLSSPM